LDHGKPRGGHRSRAGIVEIDLGNEPPLFADGRSSAMVDRRRVSVRWFVGTVLTGLCGAALMGGAVYAALDREANFAAIPERMEATLRGSLGGAERQTVTRKADKLQPVAEAPSARQVLRVATTTRVGDREVVRMRPYVRIMANLSLSTSELSANVPGFDPRKVMSASGPGTPAATPEEAGAEPDAEISFVTRDLAPLLPRVKIAAMLPMDEVIARVRETADWTGSTSPVSLANVPGGGKLAYAAEGNPDPYFGFEARIVPENITMLPKTATQATGGNTWNERTIAVKKGDSISTVLRDLGASPEEIKAIASALGARGRDGALKDGNKLRILLSPIGAAQRLQPIRVIVVADSTIEAVVALSDTGKYVSVDVQSADTQVAEAEEDDDESAGGVRLYQSVYETALRQQVPRPVIEDLVRIYSYDVDFQRRVQPGDSFEVLFAGDEETGETKGDVLFASLTVGGDTKRYYRFQTPDDGVVDYYDETGKSAKKFLVRKPMSAGIMRSGYGWRRHPILGYSKMHTGVDWAAPRGTPIYASGNGVVIIAGWESGYGKYARLRHTNGYETAYGHMSAFARGIQPGTRVRQGQIIGYVGSTGLSTGPHLHYEILVNNRFVDPLKIKLPRGRVLDGPTLANFERDRDRYDGLMNRHAPRVAETGATTTKR
jgi:murein DD-endopeptidase MepM/ murein hydrolase activator NlpD